MMGGVENPIWVAPKTPTIQGSVRQNHLPCGNLIRKWIQISTFMICKHLDKRLIKKMFLATDLFWKHFFKPASLCIILQVICTSLCMCNVTFPLSSGPPTFLCRNPIKHMVWHHESMGWVPEWSSYLVVYSTGDEWNCCFQQTAFLKSSLVSE